MAVDIQKLKAEQEKLAKKAITHDVFEKGEIQTVAGIDQAYTSDNRVISAVVVLDFNTMKELESKYAIKPVTFPYIPGFLSYRELLVMAEAYNSLDNKPDMIMIDGNGILHPRRFGLAAHFGVLMDKVCIGVAKNLLVGEIKDKRIIVDKEVRGYKMMTKEHANPLYISPGHKIGVQSAVEMTKRFLVEPHKLPEPIHLAHKLANKIKRELKVEKEEKPVKKND